LHFENNVLLYNTDAVDQIAEDFEKTFPLCREVTEQYRKGRSRVLKTGQYILRLMAPLL
jgi:cardiolipin synthase